MTKLTQQACLYNPAAPGISDETLSHQLKDAPSSSGCVGKLHLPRARDEGQEPAARTSHRRQRQRSIQYRMY
ncbi:hypothetical protein EVAR_474_1 [Eumeta japonica]|uniref:Uncharacterized protein n=1 Tax=Eumeta variegata TaxID=151549 RepID=A0A4C1SD94_EUMVA|nr:hypothetical protein EVAR_474_1 [Eumeta japonica]